VISLGNLLVDRHQNPDARHGLALDLLLDLMMLPLHQLELVCALFLNSAILPSSRRKMEPPSFIKEGAVSQAALGSHCDVLDGSAIPFSAADGSQSIGPV
jgi:hypothetical protein